MAKPRGSNAAGQCKCGNGSTLYSSTCSGFSDCESCCRKFGGRKTNRNTLGSALSKIWK